MDKEQLTKWFVNRYGRITIAEEQLLDKSFEEGRKYHLRQCKKIINRIEIEFPGDDGEPFEITAEDFKNDVLKGIEKLKKGGKLM